MLENVNGEEIQTCSTLKAACLPNNSLATMNSMTQRLALSTVQQATCSKLKLLSSL